MKALSLISTGVLVLLLGAVAPTYAQEEKHEEAKPAAKQEQAKPAAKQEQAKPAASHAEAKPAANHTEAKPAASHAEAKPAASHSEAKPAANHSEAKPAASHSEAKPASHAQQSHPDYAKNGQKDSRGHVYTTTRFGPDHHSRFVENGGREFNGRREFSYGGYWFYAGAYPPWFYQQDVYFVMGPDGLWYAVAYGNPSLTFQVNIE
jgi:hypothetical protein